MPGHGVPLELSSSWELSLFSCLLCHVRDIYPGIQIAIRIPCLGLSAVHTEQKGYSNFKFASY